MPNIKYRITTTPEVPATTSAKGTPLTSVEIDGNFKSLSNAIDTTDTNVSSLEAVVQDHTDILANVEGNLNFTTLPTATTPVAGTDLILLRQGATNTKLAVSDVRTEFATDAVTAKNQAVAAKDAAVTAKTAAEAARDAAQLSAGIYPDTASGVAAVAEGAYFSIPAPVAEGYLDLYRVVGGVAVDQGKRYPSASAIAAKAGVVSVDRVADYAIMNRAQFSPNGGPSDPETIFGANLVAYFGPRSRQVTAAGSDAANNTAIAKVYGAGSHGTFTGAGIAGASLYRYFFSAGSLVLGLKASVTNEFITVSPAAGAGAAFLGGTAPMFFICWDGGASNRLPLRTSRI